MRRLTIVPRAGFSQFLGLTLAVLWVLIAFLSPSSSSAASPPAPYKDETGTLIPAGQRYSPRLRQVLQANAIKDEDVISPKSINFYPDGTKIYVNALEGLATLVYSLPDLKKIAVIPHIFTAANANLFKNGETTVFDYQYYSRKNNLNVFSGKPVEGTFSKDGRYFFAPYYRRDFDHRASDPSAMAIIDTRIDQIVRVMPTGPLPKMVAVSPDGALLAVTHWGDNTIGLMDISSGDAAKFAYVKRLVVEPKLNTANIGGNRDKNCGHCLRGTVFTPDGLNLLVGRMSGGGVAVFSMPNGEYEGGFTDFSPSPRHLVVDSKGNLYSSDSREGTVNRVNLAAALDSLKDSPKRLVSGPKGDSLFVGSLPRTVALSPHEKSLYAVLHGQGELVRVDLDSFKVVERKKVCPRPVGLDVSRNGQFLGLTSQGGVDKAAKTPGFVGGNSFEIFKIQEPS